MRTAIVVAGPTGLFTAIALARRGHRVTIVERDPGPAPDGSWERRGVMQFHHPRPMNTPVGLVRTLGGYLLAVFRQTTARRPEVLPTALAEIEPRAREIFSGGWRPDPHPGPTRDDLATLIAPMAAAR